MIEQEIRTLLNQKIPCEFLEIENESSRHATASDESHFKVILVSENFEGMNAVRRHQTVYGILTDVMKKIHALALHLYTPAEWQERGGGFPASPDCTKTQSSVS